jgi:hypothetical protein
MIIDMLRDPARFAAADPARVAAHYRTDPKHTAGMIRLIGGQG